MFETQIKEQVVEEVLDTSTDKDVDGTRIRLLPRLSLSPK
jgi:hypothetical protein